MTMTDQPEGEAAAPLRLQRGAGARQARQEYIAPLFSYCASHSISVAAVGRRAALRQGVTTMSRTRLWRIKLGHALAPDWFIEGMCREIGQPVETVMGQEWAQRHLPAPPTPATSPAPAVLPQPVAPDTAGRSARTSRKAS